MALAAISVVVTEPIAQTTLYRARLVVQMSWRIYGLLIGRAIFDAAIFHWLNGDDAFLLPLAWNYRGRVGGSNQ